MRNRHNIRKITEGQAATKQLFIASPFTDVDVEEIKIAKQTRRI